VAGGDLQVAERIANIRLIASMNFLPTGILVNRF